MMTKQAMWSNLEITSLHAAIDLENRNQLLAGYTGNLDEAIAAFREKRTPDLQGVTAPVEPAAVRVDVAEQLGFGVAASEGDEAEHDPFDAVLVRRGAVARDQVDDTLASALIHATGRDSDAAASASRKPVRCSGEK